MSDDQKHYQLDSSSYQRPNAKWNCGLAADGLPCPKGPGGSGECGAICTPYQEGERYFCGNASALGGKCATGPLEDGSCCQMPAQCKPAKHAGQWVCQRGLCADGPLPDGSCCKPFGSCRPTRSVFSRRKQVSITVFALAVAALLAMVGESETVRKMATSPGKLSLNHRLYEKDCILCHRVGDGGATQWMDAAFKPTKGNHQSTLCADCHTELGQNAMFAHSLSAQQLVESTARIQAAGYTSSEPLLLHVARIDRPASGAELACATCHQEHHGELFDLKHMADLQCQVCHTNAFHSFAEGHPEFVDYPYKRRTRLYFDHASHIGQHFKESSRFLDGEAKPPSCYDCHEIGKKEKLMTVTGFEKMCASCHEQQIHGPSEEGIVFFSLPAIDVPALRSHGLGDIGHWPVTYPKHVEASGTTSPLTQLLLEDHSGFTSALQGLGDIDLSNLQEATPAEMKQVQEYVWALKDAMMQIRRKGRDGFQQRLATLLKVHSSETDLIGSALYDKFLEAQSRWLPDLEAELAAHAAATTAAELSAGAEDPWNQPKEVSSEWLDAQRAHIKAIEVGLYLQDTDLSIRYRPVGHEDPWIAAWIDASSSGAGYGPDEKPSALLSAKQRVFAELASPNSTGRCMKCHTGDRLAEGGLEIHWKSKSIDYRGKRFTDFIHRPHVSESSVESCKLCHQLQVPASDRGESGIFRAEFISSNGSLNTDGNQICGDFAAINKATCLECHSQSLASQSCLTCHNYHIGGRKIEPQAGK